MVERRIAVAVCDDDASYRAELVRRLSALSLPDAKRLSIEEVPSGNDLLRRYESGERFDVIFLDMIMPGIDGIQTASAIRASGDNAIIVCLTSSPEYAVDSYRIEAFDYLIKGKETPRLEETLARAVSAVSAQEVSPLLIKSGTTLHSIPCDSVEYIEVFSKKLSYHTADGGVLETYKPIRELELELRGLTQFFKIHRSIIINLRYIIELDPRFVRTVSSARLPVARGRYERLEEAFLRHTASKA